MQPDLLYRSEAFVEDLPHYVPEADESTPSNTPTQAQPPRWWTRALALVAGTVLTLGLPLA